jgi:serine/threonine-protein kinase RsbW
MSDSVLEAEIQAESSEAEALGISIRDWLAPLADASDRFAIELLCREAIANAVRHGCRSDPSKRVRVRLERSEGFVSGMIEDEGGGFVPSIRATLFDLAHEDGGMGLALISHYADRISFDEGGRVIRFEKRVGGKI